MKKIALVLMALVVGLSACDRNFEEINTNPNDPTTVPNTNILLSSLISGMDRIHGASMNMTYAGLWVQHYAKIQYIDEDRYAFRPSAIDAHWTGLYAGPLFDLKVKSRLFQSTLDGKIEAIDESCSNGLALG